MTIGKKIRDLRTEKMLSQRQLAHAIGVSQKAIDNWEKNINEPTAGSIAALAEFFGCSGDCILGRENESGVVASDGVGARAAQLSALYLRLNDTCRDELMDFAHFLMEKTKKTELIS